jgi:hypothetical protein
MGESCCPNLAYYPDIRLNELRKSMKDLSQDSWSLYQDSVTYDTRKGAMKLGIRNVARKGNMSLCPHYQP